MGQIYNVIIQHIATPPKYGQGTLHILSYTRYALIVVQCKSIEILMSCARNKLLLLYNYYLSSVHNRDPVTYIISCVKEKNGKIKIVSSFRTLKLCFFVNVLITKTYPAQTCRQYNFLHNFTGQFIVQCVIKYYYYYYSINQVNLNQMFCNYYC